MPGLFGRFDPAGPASASRIGERMRDSMRHHEWYGSAIHEDRSQGLIWGQVTLSPQSLAHKPACVGGRCVLLDGEIYDLAEHRRTLERQGAHFAGESAEELLAHGLALRGETFLRDIDGYFAAAVWEPASAALTVLNDRFGMRPLYYALTRSAFVFASEIKAILKDPDVQRRLSLRGAAQFFTFGHLLGEDTLFDSVRAMPPASLVRFDGVSHGVAMSRYWRMTSAAPFSNEDEALSEVDACFGRAVERRTAGERSLGLSLSGGLDARTILAAVPRSRRLTSISLGIRGSIDHRAASDLAQLAGARHHCHFLSEDFLAQFPSHLQTLVHLTDGHYLDQAVTVPTLPVYRELGIDVLLRGHAGELLHMDKAYAFSITRDQLDFASSDALEQWLWSHLTAYMIAGVGHDIFRQPTRDDAAALARHSLRSALDESEGYSPVSQRLWHLFIGQRLRRETAMSMQMFSSVVDVRLPYLDNEFVAAIMRVPPPLKMGDRMQSFILRQRMPSFLKVLNANTGAQMGAAAWMQELSSFRLKVLSKLRVPGYQPYERLGLWLSRALHPFLRGVLLSDRALGRDLFEPAVVRRVVAEHAARSHNHTFLLMAMLIFELGQRKLLDEESPEPFGPNIAS
jgi:asparagine synthase (glutamine-hydrolysing)